MIDPAVYTIMEQFHPGSARVLDLISPWVVDWFWYASLHRRGDDRVVTFLGQDIMWWTDLVLEEAHHLHEVLGPTIIIEVEDFFIDRFGFWTQLPNDYFELFVIEGPPVPIIRTNPEGVWDGQNAFPQVDDDE